jgi:hypothetical protein
MKKIYIIFAILVTLVATSCKKFLDINSDPATPQEVESKSLTPPLFAQMERGVQFDSRYLGPLIQNFGYRTASQTAEIHGWFGSDASGEIWRTVYYGLGNNLSLIMDDATKTKQYNYLGMAQAIRAWGWQTATDYHGEIIFKQAFEPNRFIFEYDSQADVYAEVVRLANASIANFKRTDDNNGTTAKMAVGDLVYRGVSDRWIKFNYGLLARNMNNLVNKTGTYNAAKVIEFVDLALASNADNFLIPNTVAIAGEGTFYGTTRDNLFIYKQSRMIVGLLDGLFLAGTSGAVIDPRRPTMITASGDGVFRGVNPGSGDPNLAPAVNATLGIPNLWGAQDQSNPGVSGGKFIFKDLAVFPVMTYAEMQFIKAEAGFRSGNKAIAYQAYLNGISAHIDFVSSLGTSISTAQKTAYLTSAAVKQTPETLTLRDIMLQKYIALWGHGYVETWCDLRKFNYNVGDAAGNNPYLGVFIFPNSFFPDNGGKPAQRYRPRFNSEYLWNLDALKKVGGDKVDYHTYPMWFAQP